MTTVVARKRVGGGVDGKIKKRKLFSVREKARKVEMNVLLLTVLLELAVIYYKTLYT